MRKDWGDGWQTGAPQRKAVVKFTTQTVITMILPVCAKLNDIYQQGRKFNWVKPEICPRCGSVKIWGHGFVLAYFDGFAHGILLRRYRCPDCHCVIRMKPKGYFRRFHATIRTIESSLSLRLSTGRWNAEISPSRQRHWLSALKRKAMAYFGWCRNLMGTFYRLTKKGLVPVSRAI